MKRDPFTEDDSICKTDNGFICNGRGWMSKINNEDILHTDTHQLIIGCQTQYSNMVKSNCVNVLHSDRP